MYVMGIDLGTQGARAVVVDLRGQVVADARASLPKEASRAPKPGVFEQHPEAWRDAVLEVIGASLSRFADAGHSPEKIVALSATGTSGTLCLVDADGRAVAPAIMYSDTRASAVADHVQRAGAETAQKLGIRYGASYALCKLVWVKQHAPQLLERARWALSPTDLILGWLGAPYGVSDWTNTLKAGYDPLHHSWPAFISAALGVPEAMLPSVVSPGTRIGVVSRKASSVSGLAPGTALISGATDGNTAQYAAGAAAVGSWCSTVGTTLVLKGVTRELLRDPLGRIYCHRHPDGYWAPGGASSTGAEAIAQRFAPNRLEALGRDALSRSPTDLVVYPLARKGERFPFLAPDATGFSLGTTDDEITWYAAHLEGLAYVERLSYEVLKELGARVGATIRSVGGATQSEAGLQIRADVLQREIAVPKTPHSAMGAAILAARHTAYGSVADAVEAMVKIVHRVSPRSPSKAPYQPGYQRFLRACRERGYIA